MKRTRSMSGLAGLLLAFTIMVATAQPSSGVETYRSGPDLGAHQDAYVTCRGWPYMTITVGPRMGTTPGWEFGQTVAYRIYVLDATNRPVAWLGTKDSWVTARIATKRWEPAGDAGAYTLVSDPRGISSKLPDYTWSMRAGFYRVRIDYAWLTGRGWSYASNITSSYNNELSGTFDQTTDRTCGIAPY